MTKPLLEICCANAVSCENAAALGVERIELCTALELGGISPNAALIAHAVSLELNTMVLIRPRSGDFYF
jgi:copper homeostasis protein